MKLFTLIKNEPVHLSGKGKVIPAKEFSTALTAKQLVKLVKEQEVQYRAEIAQECELLKEQGTKAGFEEGLKQWNEKLKDLENEISKVRRDMENSLVPLAMAAIKKIIGREIELKPETIADIVATSLKSVSHHRKVTVYVHKNDLEVLEGRRADLKAVFENLQSFNIATRDDLQPGTCIIETEGGIINASWDNQLKALESAFHSFLHTPQEGGHA